MIDRQLERELALLKKEFPILAILGPRQSGKTTVSQKMFPHYDYVTLEDMDHREFAQNDPRGFLDRYNEKVIIDEIQRVPQLMSYLQSH
ncbi:MAG: AAA family ATPase, partial [Spirochaetales bacterium]|nr:AAA family ATPase [Spirochaetales bacterium]